MARIEDDYRIRTVEEVIAWLSQFPKDAVAYAYEGEICGIVVAQGKEELGHIQTKEG
jgi:hypothetical protein